MQHLSTFKLTSLIFLLFLNNAICVALEFPDKPPNEHFYIDQADLISSDTGLKIDQIARQLLIDEQVALFVVIIPSLASYDATGYSIEGYAADLFDEWGIGSDDRNYGMLLLISKGDRKARIELGADWDREFDRDAKQVMDTLIIPAFKNNDFDLGIVQGVEGMNAMARNLALPKPEAPWWFLPAMVGLLIFCIALIVNLFKTGRSGWAWALIALLGFILWSVLSASSSRGGSSGGFGGGYSGGGGATGSW